MTNPVLAKPEFYLPALRAFKERNRESYIQKWNLQLVRHTNRHPECDGSPWGWYEVHPIGVTVGYWSGNGKDDLRGVDVDAWNKDASAASSGRPVVSHHVEVER